MQQGSQRPIRNPGWAFPLPDLARSVIRWNVIVTLVYALSLAVVALGVGGALLFAQHSETGHEVSAGEPPAHGHDHHALTLSPDGWEGSQAGVAYSEFNHHLAGLFVLLIGFSEMAQALRAGSFGWARMLLPAALLGAATFLLVWSDHAAWPIGPMSFTETFFGSDHEIIQHKIYGLLALTVGLVELYRRGDRVTNLAWGIPLPLFAVVGGMMLFTHSHGAHPSAEKIAMHHAVMGTLAVSAGSSRLVSAWREVFIGWSRARWETVWAGLLLLIGLQLLFYSE